MAQDSNEGIAGPGVIDVIEQRVNVLHFGSNASNRLLMTEQGGNPDSLVEFIDRAPGVVKTGQNGLLQVFSIRGVAGQRVHTRFMGVPLLTERRAGTGAAYIDPFFIDHVDVVKGPTSTLFGSGAMGGVVLIEPRTFIGAELNLGYESSSAQRVQAFGIGNRSSSAAFSHREAADGESPRGDPLHTGYEQSSLMLQKEWQAGTLRLTSALFSSRGRNIGRSNNLFPDSRIGEVTEENHDIVQLGFASGNGLEGSFYLHDQYADNEVITLAERLNRVRSESQDWGARLDRSWQLRNWTGKIGVDLDVREGVNSDEIEIDLLQPTHQTESLDLAARERNSSIYAVTGIVMGAHRLEYGVRFNHVRQDAKNHVRQTDTYTTGYIGWQWYLGEYWSVSAAAATAFRSPTLTERYFNGTTGRGSSIGNPDLEQESSPGIDLGMHWQREQDTFNLHLFNSTFENYIERSVLDKNTRSFRNIDRSRISGLELEGSRMIRDNLTLLYGAHWIRGEDSLHEPLADIPASELRVGVNFSTSRWQLRALWRHRDNRNRVAETEQAVDQANILDLDLAYFVDMDMTLSLYINNALNDTYLISADELSTLANKRTAGISLHYRFRR